MSLNLKQKPLAFWIVLGFFGLCIVFGITTFLTAREIRNALGMSGPSGKHFQGDGEVALMKIDGVIMGGDEALEKVQELADTDSIKAVVLRIDSPGGAVGPSQEIYNAVRDLRFSKKVYCSLGDLAASGGYYIASACERIFANPGTLTGSIGVIMEFMNLRGLYDWAKVDPFVLKAGKFKDVGSQSRTMTPDERALMQSMLDEVHTQFKNAVFEGRNDIGMEGSTAEASPKAASKTDTKKALAKNTDTSRDEKANDDPPAKRPLTRATLDAYADGRVFTGETALKLGFVDEIGGLRDALDAVATDTGLSDDYQVRHEIETKSNFGDLLDFGGHTPVNPASASSWIEHVVDRLLPGRRAAQLKPGVPYFLPSFMFAEGR